MLEPSQKSIHACGDEDGLCAGLQQRTFQARKLGNGFHCVGEEVDSVRMLSTLDRMTAGAIERIFKNMAVLGVLAAIGCCGFAGGAVAAEPALQLSVSKGVLYGDIGPIELSEGLQLALREGTPVTAYWTFHVDRHRGYWLDEQVAEITFTRTVYPDLVSQSWLIEDSSTGITKRVLNLPRAIDMMMDVRSYPLLDLSLLDPLESYEVNVSLGLSEGEADQRWWKKAMRFDTSLATASFKIP